MSIKSCNLVSLNPSYGMIHNVHINLHRRGFTVLFSDSIHTKNPVKDIKVITTLIIKLTYFNG